MLQANPSLQTLLSFDARVAFQDSKYYDLGVTVVLLALTLFALYRLSPAYSLYAVATLLLPLSAPSVFSPLLAMPRYAIVLFPCFIALALLLRRRWAFGAVLALSVVQFVALLVQFSTWFFVG
jgi:hypothetical protein